MDAIYQFAKNFVNIKYEDLPAGVVDVTKKEVLDALGVALAGLSAPGVKELLDLVTWWGGREESSIFYCKQKVPIPNAAQVNATMIHALDFDDTHDQAVMHTGVVIIPTCMALAETKGKVSGKELITTIALGVDMMCRLSMATRPGTILFKAGWHWTTLYGFLGAAGTAARMLGLNEEQMVNAFGIAYHQCSGNTQCTLDGALTKRMGPGFAAKGGITSALMAEKGITGAKNVLEGDIGMFPLYHQGSYDLRTLTADLGKHFEGINLSLKPYPCCRGVHPSIDAGLALVDKHNIKAEDVREVTIFVGEGHHYRLCRPFEAKCNPRNVVDAQFSIPWGVALAISRRRATMEDFTETAIKSRDILDVTSKIKVEVDTVLNSPHKMEPVRVQITMKDGRVYSEQMDDPLGSPQRPMSFGDCEKKFRNCSSHSVKKLPEERINKITQLVGRLEQVKDVRELIELLH